MSSLFKNLRRNKRDISSGTWREAVHEGWEEYTGYLGRDFVEYLEKVKERQGSASCLDLMSGGKFISEAIGNKHLTKGLSVGLEEVGRLGGRITGDVMRKKTWREVDDWMDLNRVNGFDVTVMRPIAGYMGLNDELKTFQTITENASSRTAPTGRLYLQLPMQEILTSREKLGEYLKFVKKLSGVYSLVYLPKKELLRIIKQ